MKNKNKKEKKIAGPVEEPKEIEIVKIPEPKEERIIKKSIKRSAVKTDKITAELKEIYEAEGDMPDMSRLERRPRRLWLAGLFVLLFLGAVAAAIYAGWVFWKPWERPDRGGVGLEIAGPSQVINGERVIYQIEYENRNTVPLAAVEVQTNLPSGFMVISTEPAPTDEGNVWQLGSMDVGGKGTIKFEGYFRDEVKTSLNIQAIITYRPANFSSDFQDIKTLSVLLSDSRVDMAAEGPAKAVPGDEVEYTVKYKNTSEFAYGETEIAAVFPENFIFASSEPAATSDGGDRWRITELASGTEGIIKIKGNFTAQGQGLQDMVFKFGFINNNEFRLQKEARVQTEVLAGDLVTHLFINGTEASQNLNFGENLRLSLSYDNKSGETMENVEFTVHVESDPKINNETLVIWKDLNMPDDKTGEVRDQTIVWKKENYDALGKIEKDAGEAIDFSIPLVAEPLSSLSGKYEVKIWAESKVAKIGDLETNRLIQTTPVVIAINTDLDFTASGRYFNPDGETLGFGPIPPRVNETTGYHVFWTITNSLHEIQDIRATATLPQNVTWTGRKNVEAGDITFNESTNMVTWTINRLPTSMKQISASFEVSVKPREEDVGTFIKLATESKLEALDQKTTDTLIITTDPISTDIPEDETARGKGVVVAGE
ncbi:MAG: hypothetical protein PHW53_02000 [Patescibacteria group bacterium]|nr:hypothetical protein [Patescibacteria group bacterium]